MVSTGKCIPSIKPLSFTSYSVSPRELWESGIGEAIQEEPEQGGAEEEQRGAEE